MKFQMIFSDPCLVYKKDENETVMLGIYADDLLCIGNREAIEKSKNYLKKYFEIKDEGPMREYVSCHMMRENYELLKMSQPDHIEKIEKNFKNKFKDKLYQIPAAERDSIVRTNKEDIIDTRRQKSYISGVSMLLYLINYSRPDISNKVR